MAELRAELEVAIAQLKEDLQAQLWNYYGALREPAAALKDRVEQLEERLEDFSVPPSALPGVEEAIESKFAAVSSRVAAVEQQSRLASERQTKELEAMAKERSQHFALLKSRIERMETTERDLSRRVEHIDAAAGELKEKTKLQMKMLEEVEDGIHKVTSAMKQEAVARERAMEDTQRVAKQNMQTEIAQLDQKLTKLTSDCVEASKAELLQELSHQVGTVQQQNAAALKKLDTDLKLNISTTQASVEHQLNLKLQDMQQNLQSFLRKQDTALQQRFEKELETNAASLKQHQDVLTGRVDGIKADQVMLSKALENAGKDLHACQETQATLFTFKESMDRRMGELSVDLQRMKISQEAALSHSAVEEKITSEIRSLREGIDSIKHTVDGNERAERAERAPSRPCSPSGDARSVGPLLRPMYVRPNVATPATPTQAWPGRVPVQPVRSISPPSHAPVQPVPVQPVQPVQGHVQQAVPAAFLPRPPAPASPEPDAKVPVPVLLSISCPSVPGNPAVSGEYHLVPGESVNGMPLWKHSGAELWLYCGTNRRWFVGGQDAKDWRFQCEAGFIYSEPVNGTMPDRVPGSWARFQGGVFLADPTIVVKASQEPVNGS